YINYTAFMERVIQLVGSPDDLLICGFSAGGFGTSLLASDIIENYYSDVANTTVLVDSSLLLYDDWQEVAKTIWKAPEQITARLTGDNLVLDSLTALSEAHPDVKILFDCSIRDGELARFQHYLNGGDNTVSAADGDVFEANLKEMVEGIQENFPNFAIYIWDGLKYQGKDEHLTLHTIILIPNVYKETFGNDKTIAEWIMDAVNGTMKNYGLDLIFEK
ncbi:MAG: pectin acetylesterase, partial [Lachnospiraceae bacterium]|nr:pectin acetylesterase [Lachnospiraceae bacterium]